MSCTIPISNLKLKSGVAPILDLHRAGVEIALGCDNYSCAETQNIFIAMRMLCLLPAVTDPEPGPVNAAYALKAATLAGARAVGLADKIGALKPGMMADLTILDLNEPAFVPFNSAARQIVFSEAGRAVETVLVGGRPVVRNGKLVTVDEAALAAEVEKIAPAFRRDAAGAGRAAMPISSRRCLNANREAWKVPLGFERYIGRGTANAATEACFLLLLAQPEAQHREDGPCSSRKHFALAASALAVIGAVERRIGAGLADAARHHGGAVRAPAAHRTPRGASSAVGMSEVLGQQVIIENIAGAGGMTGTARVAKAPPDGYQFVFAQRRHHGDRPDHAQAAALQQRRPTSPPAGLVVEQPIVLITRKDLPVNTLQEFVAYAKANQEKMQFGSSGVGSGSHFACAKLNAALGIEPTHVPYRGSGLAMQDLVAGRIDYFCALGAAAMGPLEAGNAKADRAADQRTVAVVSDSCKLEGAGTCGSRLLFLDGVLLPRRHARRHRAEAL